MNRIVDEQSRRNRMARDCWQQYEGHRARIAELLGTGAELPRGRVCLLGAGNCNDLDLNGLAQRFDEIRLVDLDDQALRHGMAVQQPRESARFVLTGGVDLTGIAAWLASWSPDSPPGDEQIDRCLRQAAEVQLLADFPAQDTVASVCLLSQLIDAAVLALGPSHPRLLELISAIRSRHLRLILDLLRPGGRGLLIADFVSSETCPQLATVAERELGSLARQLIEQRNFFTGLNPFVLLQRLNAEPPLQRQLGHIRLTAPWLWRFPARTYAVCALEFVKAADAAV